MVVAGYSQQLLLIQKSKVISIVDANSYQTSDFYREGKFLSQKKLCNTDGGVLVGYNWDRDSLVVYLNNTGKITPKKYYVDSVFQKLISHKVILDRVQHTRDSVSYKTKKTEIVISGYGVFCYQNKKLLWQKKRNSFHVKVISLGSSLFSPMISNNEKFVLFETNKFNKYNLIEVELETGKESVIFKNVCNYDYSSDSKNILIVRQDKFGRSYFIYNRDVEKTMELYDLSAFWLYK